MNDMTQGMLVLLLAIYATIAGAIDFLGGNDISTAEELNDHVSALHRHLAGTCIYEDGGETQNYFFDVSIRIDPTVNITVCPLADQILMGHDINLLLLDEGTSSDISDDNGAFLAGVCPEPTIDDQISTDEQRMLYFRSRRVFGFFSFFGYACGRFCPDDNSDRNRKLSLAGVTGPSDENWFSNIYAPMLEKLLEDSIALNLAPHHKECLGETPAIGVVVTETQLSDLNLSCDDGEIIEILQSVNLQDMPLPDRICDKCVSVDFSELEKGDYVKSQWKVHHGFTVTAIGGYNPDLKARIFDTGDTACVNEANGNLEFGSPNKDCQDGGHGAGEGGKEGEAGENCRAVGNALIIQESDKMCPDANPDGGILKFEFDSPVLISDIGLMDVDEEEQRIRLTYADGVSELFAFSGFGDNAVQRVICNKLNVKMLEVIFPGTGAITELNFCPECLPMDRAPSSNHCVKTETTKEIRAMEQIGFDDFESDDETEALKGWTNAQRDTSTTSVLSKFLGKYKSDMPFPHKTYKVPWNAYEVTIELDFYAIYQLGDESHNTFSRQGDVNVYVDGEQINLGLFHSQTTEVKGSTTHGIMWTRKSLGQPENLELNSDVYQKHHIKIIVSEATGFMTDGELRLSLVSGGNDSNSAGWDNVKVTVLHGCPILRADQELTSSPTSNPSFAPSNLHLEVVDLGTAINFAILSKAGVTTTGITSVTGNMGTSPIAATALTGFALIMDASTTYSTSTLVDGKVYAANYGVATPAKMTQAISDMEKAFTDAAGRAGPDHVELGAGNLSEMTLQAGLYKWSTTVRFDNFLIFDGTSTDVWILQIAGTFDAGSGAKVILQGGAKAENIFWQTSGATVFGTTSHLEGIFLAQTNIAFKAGSSLHGAALAQTAVTIIAATIVHDQQVETD